MWWAAGASAAGPGNRWVDCFRFMRVLMDLGLGCSGCVTLLGILLSLTLIGIHLGFPLVVIGVLGLIGFGVGRMVFRELPR
jgi:hypothetical protein